MHLDLEIRLGCVFTLIFVEKRLGTQNHSEWNWDECPLFIDENNGGGESRRNDSNINVWIRRNVAEFKRF